MIYSDIKTRFVIWTHLRYELLLYDLWYTVWTGTEARSIGYMNCYVCGSWVGTEIRPVELFDLDRNTCDIFTGNESGYMLYERYAMKCIYCINAFHRIYIQALWLSKPVCANFTRKNLRVFTERPTGLYDIERPTGPICYRDDLRIYRDDLRIYRDDLRILQRKDWPMVNSGLPYCWIQLENQQRWNSRGNTWPIIHN